MLKIDVKCALMERKKAVKSGTPIVAKRKKLRPPASATLKGLISRL
jgi:hypothetical protein